MFGKQSKQQQHFEELCEEYCPKILRYLFGVLGEETAARDCTQDVFLTALGKISLLMQHPNPGGFLFQTAKNLGKNTGASGFAGCSPKRSATGWRLWMRAL